MKRKNPYTPAEPLASAIKLRFLLRNTEPPEWARQLSLPPNSFNHCLAKVANALLIKEGILLRQFETVDGIGSLEGELVSIKNGRMISPPFCLYGLPRSNHSKGGLRGDSGNGTKSGAFFVGAPLQGLEFSSLGNLMFQMQEEDQAETIKLMRIIQRWAGYTYGNVWATAQWRPQARVNTSDFQRVAEHVVDQLAIMRPSDLQDLLLGEAEVRVQIKSLREAKRLIPGIGDLNMDATAESKKAERVEKLLVLDPSFQPDFRVSMPTPVEEIGKLPMAAFHLFQSIQPLPGKRSAQGWEIAPTLVAIALAVGMAARLGWIVSGGKGVFHPERVALLLGWLHNLHESERRLARHLLLSPGRPIGSAQPRSYDYLNDPYYAASVLGHHLTPHHRSRKNMVIAMRSAGEFIHLALTGLNGLPEARSHLHQALRTIGIPSPS